ncbi:MAG TPA: chemoreceptor glutamine deamidase CheD [Ectothiorhodospiraceae bacterium]|nr:chemoreceptor glutamine deamidase CheD [Ectothiorhodospiraceae bacterium]
MTIYSARRVNPSGETVPKAFNGFEKINRYWDHTNEIFAAKILPGEFYVSGENEMITTVLGSCVSACIRDRVFRIGGMNHFMLPIDADGTGRWTGDKTDRSTRYGNYAMEHLINEILTNGGMRKNLEIKVFGGGRVLAQATDIGKKNIDFVLEFIQTEGLELLGKNIGDIYPRKVNYFPSTGKVRMKKLRNMHNDTIIQREESYLHSLEKEKVESSIELF